MQLNKCNTPLHSKTVCNTNIAQTNITQLYLKQYPISHHVPVYTAPTVFRVFHMTSGSPAFTVTSDCACPLTSRSNMATPPLLPWLPFGLVWPAPLSWWPGLLHIAQPLLQMLSSSWSPAPPLLGEGLTRLGHGSCLHPGPQSILKQPAALPQSRLDHFIPAASGIVAMGGCADSLSSVGLLSIGLWGSHSSSARARGQDDL